MIKIYIHGCNCGLNAQYIRRVQAYGLKNSIPVEVINSKYNEEAREEHAVNLQMAGIELGSYPSIVVHNDNVTRLIEWNL